ncbi:hypothetical protein ERO13_A05G284200v2 [Gossypium hirsutum]|uniref:F-box/kelch-repeat protein At1g22040 isoform X4 n=2 Tax=Gossypium TaxID=3633 RepID=A0ABM3BME9_GOSHI|nr:F-box/kelch-repeat protein At1g22040-like isoform X4 [Gossypium hirsutum]KAG4201530.1 hypothetical protein ERO13_A05G284200v2 [Gossypium hirsutum]
MYAFFSGVKAWVHRLHHFRPTMVPWFLLEGSQNRLKFMGAVLSLAAPRSSINDCNEVLQSGTWKKNKSSCLNKDNSRLIPCLPDELSLQILARIPRIHYFNLSGFQVVKEPSNYMFYWRF